jgi:predicted XRE-type DNA-binding protein
MKIDEFIKENDNFKISKFTDAFSGYIYLICDPDNNIIYIGTTGNLQTRIKSHLKNPDFVGSAIYYFEHPFKKCKNLEEELIRRIRPNKNNQNNPNNHGRKIPRNRYSCSTFAETKQMKKGLRAFFKTHKLTQTEIAGQLGIPRQRINQILNSKCLHRPTIININRFLIQYS